MLPAQASVFACPHAAREFGSVGTAFVPTTSAKNGKTPPCIKRTDINIRAGTGSAPTYGNGADQPSKISSKRCARVNEIPHCCNCSGVAARNRDNTQSATADQILFRSYCGGIFSCLFPTLAAHHVLLPLESLCCNPTPPVLAPMPVTVLLWSGSFALEIAKQSLPVCVSAVP